MSKHFSDSEIDRMAREKHEHDYIETTESRRINRCGLQIREFKCVTCGKVRQFSVREFGKATADSDADACERTGNQNDHLGGTE